jgi:hypothetical protein
MTVRSHVHLLDDVAAEPERAFHGPPVDAVHSLLMVLYQRDSRRAFCPADHWLIKDASSSAFLYDIEKKKYAQVMLLYDFV